MIQILHFLYVFSPHKEIMTVSSEQDVIEKSSIRSEKDRTKASILQKVLIWAPMGKFGIEKDKLKRIAMVG